MVDDAAAAAYRRYQEEEYERRILQQIKERPSNIMRIRTFEEAKDRWRAADGTSEGITERIDNEAQGVLRKHVLSLNRIRREEIEAMRGQSTAPPIKRWMRNGVNRVALSRVRPRRRSSDPECPVCLELLRATLAFLLDTCGAKRAMRHLRPPLHPAWLPLACFLLLPLVDPLFLGVLEV